MTVIKYFFKNFTKHQIIVSVLIILKTFTVFQDCKISHNIFALNFY